MRRNIIILSALILTTSLASAQETLSLKELTKRALASHPALAVAKSEVEAEKARREGLLAPFRPQVSLNGYLAGGSGSMIFPGTVEPTNYALLPSAGTGVLNGTFMWRFYSFGRDRELAAAGSAAIRSSKARLDSESLDIAFGVRLSFAEALFKRETTKAHQAALESAQEVLRVTQARFEAGKVPEAFVLKAKADFASAERDVAMAGATESGSTARLWDASGMEQDSSRQIGSWDVPLAPVTSLDEAKKFALLHRPELVAASEEMKQMKLMASASGRSILPELSFMGMNDWAGSQGNSGSSTYKAGLVLSLPLGDGGQRRSEKQAAEAGFTKADAQFKLMKNRIEAEVVSAWAEWQASDKVQTAASAELAASEEAYRVALLRYQEGKAILAELTDSRSGLTHARLAVAEALAYQRKAWSKLMRATGDAPNQ